MKKPIGLEDDLSPSDDNIHDAEDEESLKLKLEILETKRKLRDLTKKKREQQDLQLTQSDHGEVQSSAKRRKLLAADHTKSTHSVQVPLSPSRAQISAPPPVSPARVRLGIHNTRAEEVSLKRPSNAVSMHTTPQPAQRPVSSFSERLTSARAATQKLHDKTDKLDSLRSKSFAQVQKKQASPKRLLDPRPALLEPKIATSSIARAGASVKKQSSKSKDPAYYDAFSELHLSSRNMSHTDVAKSLSGCEIYDIPRLLKEVRSPEYDPPDCENDYVVFGILAEKTSPFEQKETTRIFDRNKQGDDTRMAKNKFMVLRLCDLKWEIDCYLFGTGFEQYWKLTEGTLLAILNPAIMPPKTNQHNGRFSLKIASSEDRVMEIGIARDLGYCVSIKKDGKKCSAWVDKRKSEYCEFHVNLMVGRARTGRMEVNTMWRGHEPDVKPKQKPRSNVSHHPEYGQLWSVGGISGRSAAKLLDDDDTDALHNLTKDEASRKRIAAQQRERDLAKQLGATGGGVAGDYLRARHGITSTAEATPGEAMFVKPTAAELGLLSRKADDQRLSPAKDRRRHFGIGAVSSAGTEAMGWGGARKYDLLQPKQSRLGSPERGQTKIDHGTRSALPSSIRARSSSPKKKARFMLDRGVREPGRESGGNELLRAQHNDDDNDDDDLDIV
ncbi:hypothetical protein AMS68_000630 [Peltaster fructicola]|uniref:Uncharacterized protein n=1 Tax=Peltaster fructicola TaxID=286661 RepID=A0A6H0XK51_9PEZI|nr:hypothetical protein AMS68_000630 [Peltaster fructicola]